MSVGTRIRVVYDRHKADKNIFDPEREIKKGGFGFQVA